MNQGSTIITQFTHALQGLAIPVAILGMVIIGLALAATPVARQWSTEARDSIKWVLVGVVVVTLASSIVGLTTIFGNGGP